MNGLELSLELVRNESLVWFGGSILPAQALPLISFFSITLPTLDFYNSSSAERRHAIENWKFLEQEQAFGLATGGQKSTSQKSSPPPRLFEVFPNGNTTSVDFFEFNEEDQQHSCFWSPENVRTFRDGHRGHGGDDDEELHYDPDCSSTCTSFDLQFNCLTEHFANFMEIGENPMRLMIKVEKLLNTTKLQSSSSGGRHSSTDSKTAMIASDRPQRFEYAKVAKLSCGVSGGKFVFSSLSYHLFIVFAHRFAFWIQIQERR